MTIIALKLPWQSTRIVEKLAMIRTVMVSTSGVPGEFLATNIASFLDNSSSPRSEIRFSYSDESLNKALNFSLDSLKRLTINLLIQVRRLLCHSCQHCLCDKSFFCDGFEQVASRSACVLFYFSPFILCLYT